MPMMQIPEADARRFENMWICIKCNARNRGSQGKKPDKCRKCNSKDLRKKRKRKKITK